jgi:hypothetical protein
VNESRLFVNKTVDAEALELTRGTDTSATFEAVHPKYDLTSTFEFEKKEALDFASANILAEGGCC